MPLIKNDLSQNEEMRRRRILSAHANGIFIWKAAKNTQDWTVCSFPDWDWDFFDYKISPGEKEYLKENNLNPDGSLKEKSDV